MKKWGQHYAEKLLGSGENLASLARDHLKTSDVGPNSESDDDRNTKV